MKEELKKVLAKAGECVQDAKYLYEGERYEAAVNRAYYAMFTAVQGCSLTRIIFVKTHKGAKAKFHEIYLKENLLPAELGKLLENASALRQQADYDFEMDVSKADALQTIHDAEKLLSDISGFLKHKSE